MTTEERKWKALLRYKGYPVRITTAGGKFIYHHTLRYGPFPMAGIAMFESLEEAVRFAIRDVEIRNQPISQ